MNRPDSAQFASALGFFGSFVAANYDRIAATLCALAGLAYTLWKWHREAKRRTTPPIPRD